MAPATRIPAADISAAFSSTSIDLLSKPLGSRILAVSDEFFAAADNLTTPTPPITKPGVYTYAGAWYDGWETRRHNAAPYDFVIFRLGVASGLVRGVEIDTGFFNGNHAPEVAVEGCFAASDDEVAAPSFDKWEVVLDKDACGPACRQAWKLGATVGPYTHVRLRMFPDGGIGRFRLYGDAVPVFPESVEQELDLAACVNGGVATRCSDQHFGTKDNLLLPGRGVDMGDGWETKRSRGEHIDWVVVKLGAQGRITRIVVDTAHFRGNFPKQVRVLAAEGPEEPDALDEGKWVEVLGAKDCAADKEHEFAGGELVNVEGRVWRFVKLVIIPDGGVKRFRVFGTRAV